MNRDLAGLAAAFRGRAPAPGRWPGVLDMANRGLVTASLALVLQDAPDVPEPVQAFMQDVLARNRRRNRALAGQAAEAARALNRSGVEPVLLKGAAGLASASAARREGRILCDLDLLVRPSEAEAAIAALERIGYQLFSRGRGADLHAVAELVREGDWGMIDLHQRPPGPPGMAEPADLRERARPARLEGARALVPDPAAELYLLMLHDQFHDGDYWSGRLNLRHLVDIRDLTDDPDGVDWDRLAALVRSPVARNALDTQLVDARWLTGAPVPRERLRRLWPRLQHWRRLTQVSRPVMMLPFALATAAVETTNLAAHGRRNRADRKALFAGREPLAPRAPWLSDRLGRLRDIFGEPVAGKL